VKRIETLLNREIGLNAGSIGRSAIEAAVKIRLRESELRELAEYVIRLEQSAEERRALVEEIVVSETWFFRDDEVFKAIGRRALGWLLGDRPLRVLSLPCATGEEAYSVSMSLLEVGLKPGRYLVRGVDVSERALSHARRALYGKISFRGAAAPTPKAYFEAVEGGYQVAPLAREAVLFERGNVLEQTLFPARSFDIVLCRNLLIYLDPPARTRALDNLAHWLDPDGWLLAGHAEVVELMDPRFRRLPEVPFAYVRQPRELGPQPRSRSEARAVAAARGRPTARSEGQTRKVAEQPAPRVEAPRERPSLEQATALANAGQLEAARRLCERLIAEAGASSEAYCLLGIIRTAAGDRDAAIECFNKSLYLNQSHHEALLHLALLHEERGEHSTARNFRRRAERARRVEGK
jgi:chemotaxis protein methyltransferase WspC